MGELSDTLYEMGFTPTGRQSPVDEDGELWSDGFEVVCDVTGTVVSDPGYMESTMKNGNDDEVFRYRNSDRVKLIGGFTGSYRWGKRDGKFRY